MRVCLLTTADLACETGSTLHARDLALSLSAQGHDVDVLCATLPAGDARGVRYHRLPIPLEHPVFVDRPISSNDLLLSIRQYAEKLGALHAESGLDLVHCHYATFTAAAGMLFWLLHGVPYVVSTFGRDLTLGAERDPRYRRMAQSSLRDAAHVIACTERLAQLIKGEFGVPERRVTVLPMGIDGTMFDPNQDGRAVRERMGADGVVLLVLASAFGPEKGIDSLLEALSHTDRRARLWILGEDDEPAQANRRRIESLTVRLGLQHRVHLWGRVAHNQIPAYLAAADLVVDPRLAGNYSSSMLEALVMGKAVIGSDAANEWGALEDGVNGLLFPAGDAAGLSAAINELVQDPARRAILTRSAKERAPILAQKFRIDTVASRTSDIYREVCKAAKAASR
jgi:L-malate glycosyltransferase